MPISPIPQPQQNLSYAQYGQVQSHENANINNSITHDTKPSFETNIVINDSEKHISTSSFNNTTPVTQHGNYTSEGLTDRDERLSNRLYREETENNYVNNTVTGNQTGGMYSPKGEATSYYANTNEPGQGVSEAQIQGTTASTEERQKIVKADYDLKIKKGKKWKPYFTYLVSFIQLGMFIYEFVKNQELFGSLIQTSPFNPMIGPSSMTLIQLGARFNPCMRQVQIDGSLDYKLACSNVGGQLTADCTLIEACGFNGFGFRNGIPDQWFRFITPIFLHAGVIHFLFNMFFQLRTGGEIEQDIGWWRYSIIYMASGTFGFVFGGNFAAATIPSMGASGSLFGIIGILLLDMLKNWKIIKSPCWEFTKLLFMIVISFLIGLLPGLDNFSHIGGFIMGILTGLILLPTIKSQRLVTWILRILAIPTVALLFYFTIKNFYTNNPSEKCPWCKYLSCLPLYGWCEETGIRST